MTESSDAPPARFPEPPPALPEASPHEPAVRPWELELLISGAVVFSLLQMPDAVDRWFAGVEPHLGGRTSFGVFMFYAYLKLILYTLITCFVVHIVMRAYWVGLIGLESVFPHGVRWEETTYSPVMLRVFRERMGRVQTRIDAADRFCSILFPLAFTVVMLFCFSIVLIALGAALAFGASRLLFGGRHFAGLLVGIFAVVMVVPGLTWLLDRRYGARVVPGGRGERFLRRAAVVSYYVNAMPLYGTTFMTLVSNVRKGVRQPAVLGLLTVLFGVFFVKDLLLQQGMVITGDHLYLPDDGGRFAVGSSFYESQRRDGEVLDRIPSIQSDVIRDPFVKLFIPYSPLRHGRAFARLCPAAKPLSASGVRMDNAQEPDSAAVRAVLDCWARLQPVTLNGRPIRPDFRFYTHPRSGVRGVLAYIPVDGLPRGENLLTVGVAPRTPEDDARRRRIRGDHPDDPYYIQFWR